MIVKYSTASWYLILMIVLAFKKKFNLHSVKPFMSIPTIDKSINVLFKQKVTALTIYSRHWCNYHIIWNKTIWIIHGKKWRLGCSTKWQMIVQYALSIWRSKLKQWIWFCLIWTERRCSHTVCLRLAKQCIHIFIQNERKKKKKIQQNKK